MGVVAKSNMRKGFLIYEKSMNFQALRYEYVTTFLKELLSLAIAQHPYHILLT
jgi:hypothetical protein